MRILLVEDDAQMNEALKIFFCKAGYTVLQAYNAKEAEWYLDKGCLLYTSDAADEL